MEAEEGGGGSSGEAVFLRWSQAPTSLGRQTRSIVSGQNSEARDWMTRAFSLQ